ncbi:CmcJ/NvfI family oxidoreductase [Nostoc sp. 106C]|uniref:CmcJ/NvfI family oxidoreductase n=1 Tax=Nostoc sp. 106C TaxID=1932667 RepID=UPI000A361F4E|nr:CmcJ/NvfI family oxidoreductase [Nostoc sp. 106C]OUL19688.1 methyltransferase [Nostoc sp. 106C]
MSFNSQVIDKSTFQDLPYVEANLNYLVPMDQKPVNYTYEPPSGTPRSNTAYEIHKLRIYNARFISKDILLDQEGFAFTEHNTNVQNFYDEDEVTQVYYPEAEQLLKDVTGATKVVIFDRTLRNADLSKPGENKIREPGKRVHNDFTAKSGYTRARWELEKRGLDNDEIEALLKQRFAIINVWRGIADIIQESPLALTDARSIAPQELVPSDLVYPDRIGETYAVTYNPEHKWYYFPQMRPNEVIFIKCFDSAENGPARFSAHSAFDDPTSPADAPARQSIELRTLVFYPA